MAVIGYHLSSEEHDASTLVRNARLAEDAGFGFASISDHFHPWLERQGHSPFVWSVLGGIAATTERLEVGTMVTCPIMRVHPVLVAQAAATVATMAPGRFFLGVGTGERLNEHVTAQPWPSAEVRLSMLDEAIDLIRALWRGKLTTRRGEHFDVENARLFEVPDPLPPIYVAASGDESGELAARLGQGLISLDRSDAVVSTYRDEGGTGPTISQTHVCVARTRDEALGVVEQWWPNTGLPGSIKTEVPLPRHFEEAVSVLHDDDIQGRAVLGRDVGEHVAEIRRYVDSGYDHLTIHQIGPDQQAFLDFYGREVMPALREELELVGSARA